MNTVFYWCGCSLGFEGNDPPPFCIQHKDSIDRAVFDDKSFSADELLERVVEEEPVEETPTEEAPTEEAPPETEEPPEVPPEEVEPEEPSSEATKVE